MRGSDHYREAEKLLANAQRHITEDPRDMRIAEVSAYAAQVHATLAQAAATALDAVTGYVGDSDEISAWARITGLLPPRDGVISRACEFENHTRCAGCGCGCHEPRHTCVPFDDPEARRAECRVCWEEAKKEREA